MIGTRDKLGRFFKGCVGFNNGKSMSSNQKKKLSAIKLGKTYEQTNHFKGGRIDRKGYVGILIPPHSKCSYSKYVPEHRLIVEYYLGRPLTSKEEVHHKNGIKNDNRVQNLMCFINKSAHRRYEIGKSKVYASEIIFNGSKI